MAGQYIADCQVARPARSALDQAAGVQLWDLSRSLAKAGTSVLD